VTLGGLPCTQATASHPDINPSRVCFSKPNRALNDSATYYPSNNHTPYTTTCSSSGVPCDLYYHGTAVASVLLGSGSLSEQDSGGFFLGTGIVPSAGLVVTKSMNGTGNQVPAFGSSGSTVFQWAADATAAQAFIQNYSSNDTNATPGEYNSKSQSYDSVVRGVTNDSALTPRTPILLTVSSGNINAGQSILTRAPATGKNVLAVGASESVRPTSDHSAGTWWAETPNSNSYRNVWRFSAHGTNVQRGTNPWEQHIKPELMAPATHVTLARSSYFNLPATPIASEPQTSGQDHQGWINQSKFGILLNGAYHQLYLRATGTSFAAPVGAGAALIASRIYSSSPGAASPALLKAMLTATARSMRGGLNYSVDGYAGTTPVEIGPAPDDVQGFGLIDITDITDSSLSKSYVNQDAPVFTSAGSTWERTYTVTDSTRPVKMSLAWSDAASGIPLASGASSWLLNDLDLEVYIGNGATCNVYRGNNIGLRIGSTRGEESTVHSCSGGGFDRKNNVEKVIFYPNADGIVTFTVRVKAHTLSARAVPCASGCPTVSQDFALYVQNATAVTTANLPAPTAVNAAGSATQTSLSWTGVGGVNKYRVVRTSGTNTFTTDVTDATSYIDSSASPGMYRYAVQAVTATATSAQSMGDYAYVGTFTDDSLVPGVTTAKAAHLQELRTYVDDLRLAIGMPAATYQSAATAGLPIRGTDISELRYALDAARANSAFGLPAVVYSNDTTTGGLPIRAVDITEIRNALR
jgi:hypothetical protein